VAFLFLGEWWEIDGNSGPHEDTPGVVTRTARLVRVPAPAQEPAPPPVALPEHIRVIASTLRDASVATRGWPGTHGTATRSAWMAYRDALCDLTRQDPREVESWVQGHLRTLEIQP